MSDDVLYACLMQVKHKIEGDKNCFFIKDEKLRC